MLHVESYERAIEYLYGRINYERVSGAAYSLSDFRLERMRSFLASLGNPQEEIPAVHIAGTKGKGSTAALLAGILSAAGYRTGLFTSPHLSVFEERMRVDGRSPQPEQLVELVNSLIPIVDALDHGPGRMGPTYFEIATALAWRFFQQCAVQVAVLEVGLGGRLDATNVCRPLVTIITSISRDHTRQLGSRLSQIAAEKGGIIKTGVPVVTGNLPAEAARVMADLAREHGAPLRRVTDDIHYTYRPRPLAEFNATSDEPGIWGWAQIETASRRWDELPLRLPGEHQAHNAALVVAAVEVLREQGWTISDEAVLRGFRTVSWPARVELMRRRPDVVIDAAHNWAAVGALVAALRQAFLPCRRVLVFAATQDKDVTGMLRRLLPEFETIILTCYQNNPRAVPVAHLQRLVNSLTDREVHTATDPATAWEVAQRLSGPDDLICITGSFFLAAEMRELLAGTDPHRAEEGRGARD